MGKFVGDTGIGAGVWQDKFGRTGVECAGVGGGGSDNGGGGDRGAGREGNTGFRKDGVMGNIAAFKIFCGSCGVGREVVGVDGRVQLADAYWLVFGFGGGFVKESERMIKIQWPIYNELSN